MYLTSPSSGNVTLSGTADKAVSPSAKRIFHKALPPHVGKRALCLAPLTHNTAPVHTLPKQTRGGNPVPPSAHKEKGTNPRFFFPWLSKNPYCKLDTVTSSSTFFLFFYFCLFVTALCERSLSERRGGFCVGCGSGPACGSCCCLSAISCQPGRSLGELGASGQSATSDRTPTGALLGSLLLGPADGFCVCLHLSLIHI